MTGYGLRQAIAGSVGHFWQESFGQLYPTLRRLAQEGLVEARATPRRPGPGSDHLPRDAARARGARRLARGPAGARAPAQRAPAEGLLRGRGAARGHGAEPRGSRDRAARAAAAARGDRRPPRLPRRAPPRHAVLAAHPRLRPRLPRVRRSPGSIARSRCSRVRGRGPPSAPPRPARHPCSSSPEIPMSAIVSVQNVSKVYMLGKTEVPAVRERLDRGGGGRVPLHRRAVRLREDDAPEPHRLRGHADRRDGGRERARHRPPLRAGAHRPAPAHHRVHLPELQPRPGAVGVPERRVPAAPAGDALEGRAAGQGARAARRGRASRSTPATARASSPAGSASASPSRARS